MQAVILAAGKARRLYPLCNRQPKCLLKVAGQPIISHLVRNLREMGVEDIIAVTGHYGEQVQATLKNEVSYIYNPYFAASGDLVSLWCARKAISGPFMYLYSDLILRPGLLTPLLGSSWDARIAAVKKACDAEDEKIQLRNGRVVAIGKEVNEAVTYGEYIGVSAFSKLAADTFWRLVRDLVEKKGAVDELSTFALRRFVDLGNPLRVIDVEDKGWMEVDFITDYERAVHQAPLILNCKTSCVEESLI